MIVVLSRAIIDMLWLASHLQPFDEDDRSWTDTSWHLAKVGIDEREAIVQAIEDFLTWEDAVPIAIIKPIQGFRAQPEKQDPQITKYY